MKRVFVRFDRRLTPRLQMKDTVFLMEAAAYIDMDNCGVFDKSYVIDMMNSPRIRTTHSDRPRDNLIYIGVDPCGGGKSEFGIASFYYTREGSAVVSDRFSMRSWAGVTLLRSSVHSSVTKDRRSVVRSLPRR